MRRAMPQSFGQRDRITAAFRAEARIGWISERAGAAVADPYNWERHGSETIGPFNPVAREGKCKRRVSQDKWKKELRLPPSFATGNSKSALPESSVTLGTGWRMEQRSVIRGLL